MSSFALLQPQLMTTEQLREHLKVVWPSRHQPFSFCLQKKIIMLNHKLFILQRFPNRNISTLSRDELLKLYSTYAIPKARRPTSTTDVEMTPAKTNVIRENEHKRSRHQMVSGPTVETVTNACKKIRLISTEVNHKRPCQPSPMVCIMLGFSMCCAVVRLTVISMSYVQAKELTSHG